MPERESGERGPTFWMTFDLEAARLRPSERRGLEKAFVALCKARQPETIPAFAESEYLVWQLMQREHPPEEVRRYFLRGVVARAAAKYHRSRCSAPLAKLLDAEDIAAELASDLHERAMEEANGKRDMEYDPFRGTLFGWAVLKARETWRRLERDIRSNPESWGKTKQQLNEAYGGHGSTPDSQDENLIVPVGIDDDRIFEEVADLGESGVLHEVELEPYQQYLIDMRLGGAQGALIGFMVVMLQHEPSSSESRLLRDRLNSIVTRHFIYAAYACGGRVEAVEALMRLAQPDLATGAGVWLDAPQVETLVGADATGGWLFDVEARKAALKPKTVQYGIHNQLYDSLCCLAAGHHLYLSDLETVWREIQSEATSVAVARWSIERSPAHEWNDRVCAAVGAIADSTVPLANALVDQTNTSGIRPRVNPRKQNRRMPGVTRYAEIVRLATQIQEIFDRASDLTYELSRTRNTAAIESLWQYFSVSEPTDRPTVRASFDSLSDRLVASMKIVKDGAGYALDGGHADYWLFGTSEGGPFRALCRAALGLQVGERDGSLWLEYGPLEFCWLASTATAREHQAALLVEMIPAATRGAS